MMNDLFIYLLISILGIALGFVIGKLMSGSKTGILENKLETLEDDKNQMFKALLEEQTEKEELLKARISAERD